MPEFAATTPSRPLPATTVDIALETPLFRWRFSGCGGVPTAKNKPSGKIGSKDVYNVAVPCLSRSVEQDSSRSRPSTGRKQAEAAEARLSDISCKFPGSDQRGA